jgi:hypothetical protein
MAGASLGNMIHDGRFAQEVVQAVETRAFCLR